ncbi:MAG: hypothetical protein MRY21_07610 [Simkaniaceae bacterium]|nr:hypothetical protein [Simkaniaceae bacterium]
MEKTKLQTLDQVLINAEMLEAIRSEPTLESEYNALESVQESLIAQLVAESESTPVEAEKVQELAGLDARILKVSIEKFSPRKTRRVRGRNRLHSGGHNRG